MSNSIVVNFNNQLVSINWFHDLSQNSVFDLMYRDNNLIVISFIVFLMALVGLVFNVRNIIVTLLLVELLYVSTMFGFIVYSLTYFDTVDGWLVAFFLILIAACESAVGLGILILLSRFEETIDFFEFSRIRG